MKKKIRFIVLATVILICFFTVAFITMRDMQSKGIDTTDFMYARFGKNKINVFESNGELYFFLPSFLNEEDLKLSYEAKKHEINYLRSENLASVFVTTRSKSLDAILADKDYKESGRI
ncbi:MAG: hypothetical protein J6M92_05440, partial [Oribacterium sp.]|nr:hypothetical protein [Oribacterium sp.]